MSWCPKTGEEVMPVPRFIQPLLRSSVPRNRWASRERRSTGAVVAVGSAAAVRRRVRRCRPRRRTVHRPVTRGCRPDDAPPRLHSMSDTKRWSVRMNDRLLRRREVEELTGLSRASIYRLKRDGRFPSPVRVSDTAVRWKASDITIWIHSRPVATSELGSSSAAAESPG